MGPATDEVDAIIGNADDWRGETLSRLRTVVLAADPAIEEQVTWKNPSRLEGIPVLAHHGNLCIGEMLESAVRLTFPKGAQLADPQGLFKARLDSASIRAVDVREGEALREAALTALVREAAAANG